MCELKISNQTHNPTISISTRFDHISRLSSNRDSSWKYKLWCFNGFLVRLKVVCLSSWWSHFSLGQPLFGYSQWKYSSDTNSWDWLSDGYHVPSTLFAVSLRSSKFVNSLPFGCKLLGNWLGCLFNVKESATQVFLESSARCFTLRLNNSISGGHRH